MTVSIPHPIPDWIYEGTNASKFEDATGIVTNRAPKQIQLNVETIAKNINEDLDPRISSIEKLRQVYKDSPVYNNQTSYSEWDVVNDGNGVLYISNKDKNLNHPLKELEWWVPVNIFINDDIVDEYHSWSSAKLEEYLINHNYDASRIPINGGNAEEAMNETKLRVDTKENWELHNPILQKGEVGIQQVVGANNHSMFKIGDGVSTWTQLGWSNDRQWVIDYINGKDQTGAEASTIVHTFGNETINGTKTFTSDIIGTVTRAKYADLAEYYEQDGTLKAGMLFKFGGDKEITISTPVSDEHDGEVNGIVSLAPAFIMNNNPDREGDWVPITISGRVPVLCTGTVEKFDYIINSQIKGRAKAVKLWELQPNTQVLGRALESKSDETDGLVLCSVQFNLVG